MVWAEQVKKCGYCHEDVSIFESLTEFGKHYHEQCYIHQEQKAIEAYKKKWINGTMTNGDKVDIVDRYNLVQKLMGERRVFEGFVLDGEIKTVRNALTKEPEKLMLYKDKDGCFPILDEARNRQFVLDHSPTMTIYHARMRPQVKKIKSNKPVRLLTVEDVPKLMESLP